MGRKKKANRGKPPQATANAADKPTENKTTIGVYGDVTGSIGNIVVDSTVQQDYHFTINVYHDSSTPLSPGDEKRLVHELKRIITSEGGGKEWDIPIEKVTDAFFKVYKTNFKAASRGKKLIPFLKAHDKDFKLEERRGNWRVSLHRDFALAPGDRMPQPDYEEEAQGACAFPRSGAMSYTTATASTPADAGTFTSSPGTPALSTESSHAPLQGLQSQPAEAIPLSAPSAPVAASKASVPIAYDIEDVPGATPSTAHLQETPSVSDFSSPIERIFQKAQQFKHGVFALITGPLPKYITRLEGISNIPWQIVIDLDENSRDEGGLLFTVEDFIQRKRSLHISDWTESSVQIRHNATIWCFAKGRREKPESRVQDYKDWKIKCLGQLDVFLNELASFVQGCSILTVLVFWNDEVGEYLNYVTCKLNEKLHGAVKIVLCVDKDTTSGESLDLQYLQRETDVMRDNVSLEHLIASFTRIQISAPEIPTEFRLPTADGSNDPGIDPILHAQLSEDLDVLYMKNPGKTPTAVEDMQDAANKFFRGETLSWSSRYNFDADPLDVKRDIHDSIVQTLKDHLEDKDGVKTATFNLFHTPGSGGTTLGQRVLWDLKDHFPCVQVHFGRGPVRDISSKIDKIYRLTHKPVVCLIDGEDDLRIRQIKRQLKHGTFLILAVQRCRHIPQKKEKGSRRFWLDGTVSKQEAPLMALKFAHYCESHQKNALLKLSREVSNGKKHHLFEFGLTAFLHEFRGIRSLVRGYLNLGENSENGLSRDQTILGYLSLVYYYGQTSIPCQFFAGLLRRDRRDYIGLDDFSVEVQQLSVEDDEYGHNIRICHNLVAQEILEQILTLGNAPAERSDSISRAAGRKLHLFTMEFIDYVSDQIRGIPSHTSPITWMLTRTIIFRDFKDMGQSDTQRTSRKPDISRLLSDIVSHPPFEERLQVLRHLTVRFPEEPNFFAHLGRFYSKHRPNDEEEAEEVFETALELCYKRSGGEGTNINEMDESMRVMLMHIYHMYGTAYSRRVGKFTGRYFGDNPTVNTLSDNFDARIGEVLALVERACELFHRVREVTPPGLEESYGYYGEINVRLQVCDFIHRQNPDKVDLGQYATDAKVHPEASNFVKESIMVIDELFYECYSFVNEDDIDNELRGRGLLTWYNALLGEKARLDRVYASLKLDDDIRTRRLKVAAKKLLYSRARNLAVIENITEADDIDEIVRCYEANFDDVHNKGLDTSKRLLDVDYREWLVAIRHPKFSQSYSLTEVLWHVTQWHEFLHSPYSLFYLFILNSLIGFGDNFRHGSAKNLSIAQNQLEDLAKFNRHVVKPRFPREWLGKTGKGIKRLIPGSRLLRLIDGRIIRPSTKSSDSLTVCKGTICKPNRSPMGGYISLDLGDNYVEVKVFYIPSKAELVGECFSDRRVEFLLGFSIDHGYEAFNVTLLLKTSCGNCGNKAELRSGETTICSKCNHRLEAEELPEPSALMEAEESQGAAAGGSG